MTSDGTRLQMIVCSATLHAFEVKKMAERLMHFPTWVDLKVMFVFSKKATKIDEIFTVDRGFAHFQGGLLTSNMVII